MDVFRELMEKLGAGTTIEYREDDTYLLKVPRKEGRGFHEYTYEDPIDALEEALEQLGPKENE